MSNHKLVIDKDVVKNDALSTKQYPESDRLKYQLFYQLSRITREKGALKHDDRLDALAMAVQYWVDRLNVDVEKQMHENKLQQLEEFRKKYSQVEPSLNNKRGNRLRRWR